MPKPASRVLAPLKRALDQFLLLPLIVVIVFLLVTAGTYVADLSWTTEGTPPGFAWLGHLLGDGPADATLLSTLTSSIITVTSITFSLLLIALQQASSALTTKVTDQFLLRRTNQFFFGYFVGLSIYVLLNLATASKVHRPIFATGLTILLTMVALCMIVAMIYSTIDQMQPTQIVRSIHRHILSAREHQTPMLQRTRREPRPDWIPIATLRADGSGHVSAIDIDRMRAATFAAARGEIEVEMIGSIGRYIAHSDPMVVLRSPSGTPLAPDDLAALRARLFEALSFDQDRDLKRDAACGIQQLATIGWTSVSTAKSNPAPGLDVLESLRDILSRWAEVGPLAGDPTSLVVVADTAPREILDTIENLVLVSSESKQAQSLADALDTIAMLLPIVPDTWAQQLADIARRVLASLGRHVLTAKLEGALDGLASALNERGFDGVARSLGDAAAELAAKGVTNPRSARKSSQG